MDKKTTIEKCSSCGENHKEDLTVKVDKEGRLYVNCPTTNKKVYIIYD